MNYILSSEDHVCYNTCATSDDVQSKYDVYMNLSSKYTQVENDGIHCDVCFKMIAQIRWNCIFVVVLQSFTSILDHSYFKRKRQTLIPELLVAVVVFLLFQTTVCLSFCFSHSDMLPVSLPIMCCQEQSNNCILQMQIDTATEDFFSQVLVVTQSKFYHST